MNNLGNRIKQRRKELDISVDDLAEKIGKDRATVYRYEKGDIAKLPIDIMMSLSSALQTTPAELMGIPLNEVYDMDYNKEEAMLLSAIRRDKELSKAIQKLCELSPKNRNHVIELIHILSDGENNV